MLGSWCHNLYQATTLNTIKVIPDGLPAINGKILIQLPLSKKLRILKEQKFFISLYYGMNRSLQAKANCIRKRIEEGNDKPLLFMGEKNFSPWKQHDTYGLP